MTPFKLSFRHFSLLSFSLCLLATAQAQTRLYSWQSPSGTVQETGGILEHVNQNGRNLINVPCADYYTFVLNGDRNYISAGYDVDECSHMKLTLLDGVTLREGDEIEVTAMRNNVADRPASIYFLFHVDGNGETAATDVPLVDTNVWNNLSLAKDDTFGGGTEHAPRQYVDVDAATFTPSTYTFVVPKEADGASYVRITRNETGNLLYVSHLTVTRPADTAISSATIKREPTSKVRKYVDGTRGLVVSYGDRLYNVTGATIK